MRFQRIRYLDWAKRRFDAAPPKYDLASSGMAPPSNEELGIDPGARSVLGGNTFGLGALRERIGARYGTDTAHVLTAQGTSHANFLVLAALLEPGDLALCEWPVFEPLWRCLEALGARVEFLRRDEPGYALDPLAYEDAFARGAKVAIVSDLHNPSAVKADPTALARIARSAARHGAWLVVDEVYLSGVFDGAESAWGLSERVVVTASLTKTWGLGALRAGWAIAPPEVVRRAHEVNDHWGVTTPYVAEVVALAAFDRLEALTERARVRREANWPLVRELARNHAMELSPSAGGFIAWMRLPGEIEADAFVERLVQEHDTLVVPGSFFGGPHHIRVGFGAETAVVRAGIARIEQTLASIR